MNVFSANSVGFRTPSKQILDGVSFDIQKGSFTTLIGPNGAGKSTLLKLMLGFLKPSTGTLNWQSSQRLGYMPQKLQIDTSFPLSVGRLFDLKPGGVAPEDRDRIERLTQTLELQHRLFSELSGGELQRVLLTYALLGNPDVVLLDEPMQGLDIDSEALFLNILHTLKYQYGKTLFMVSHDLHMVFKHSDHVICLQKHVCCQGAPSSIKDDPAYHVLFGQRKDSLMALYAHQHDHTHDHIRDHIHGEGCNHE
ncbi:metal ABC transporter ATP-binding protein [Candidatus Bodocaedibacter vickermanii]|uniref:Zinc import ATP-binding protein ZnuC n=1 Tax=Candidatus Bodocaedibacter vickermanii TaxID=2741701 RepID=A0A7L9RRY1_9PROT|nr:Zinc import ATP-binding protein ZnuC [Candidatus Paracaedibacteraceae bacterium 'Lake Konstanz']